MKWFKEVFLKSFENCDGKRVTEKQANIFKKYLEFQRTEYNTDFYFTNIENKKITLQCSSSYNGCCYDKKGRHTKYMMEYFLTIK